MAASASSGDTAPDHTFKLLMIGDAGVGKSSLLLRFTDNSFDGNQPPTIGVDFKVQHLELQGKNVKTTIWDTAGQERFRTLTSTYYRGAHGMLLVYDITRPETFENLSQWMEEAEQYCSHGGRDVVKLLVGNKLDLESMRAVSRDEAQSWARDRGMMYLEASAKDKTGVEAAFEELVCKILERPENHAEEGRGEGVGDGGAARGGSGGGGKVDVGGGRTGGGGDGAGFCC